MFKFVRPKSKQSPKQPQRSDNNVESNSGAQSGQLSTDEHSSSSQALPSWSTTNTTSDAVNVKSNNKISSNPGGNIAIIRPGGGGGGGSSGNYIKNDPNKRSSSTRFEPSSKINSVRSRTFDGLQLIPHKKKVEGSTDKAKRNSRTKTSSKQEQEQQTEPAVKNLSSSLSSLESLSHNNSSSSLETLTESSTLNTSITTTSTTTTATTTTAADPTKRSISFLTTQQAPEPELIKRVIDNDDLESPNAISQIQLETEYVLNDSNSQSNLVKILKSLDQDTAQSTNQGDDKMVLSNNNNIIEGREPSSQPILVRHSRLNNRYFTPNVESFATVIAQGPSVHQSTNVIAQSDHGGYFAQCIPQGGNLNRHYSPQQYQQPPPNHLIDQAQRILEIHTEPNVISHVNSRKRVRSPSLNNNNNNTTTKITSTSTTRLSVSPLNKRSLFGLLNLATNFSNRHRSSPSKPAPQATTAVKPKKSAGLLPRSLSLNFLYHKRQGDLRRQNMDAIVSATRLLNQTLTSPSKASFTTEDIEDIYMPKKLDLFERKLKATVQEDVEANYSEEEEYKMRHERLGNKMALRNKSRSASKHSVERPIQGYSSNTKLIINLGHSNSGNTSIFPQHQTSYSNQTMYHSRPPIDPYYTNLNNRIKSSVSNLVRISNEMTKQQHQSAMSHPYTAQYYSNSVTTKFDPATGSNKIHRADLQYANENLRRCRSSNESMNEINEYLMMDTDDVSTTSSEDTRPIVPERINKPDVSLKNKILKTINKSLLLNDLSGIDLNMLKLNDSVRKTLKKIERSTIERDLNLDLVRSFSFGHLADLRRADLKYMNLLRENCADNNTRQRDLSVPNSSFETTRRLRHYYTAEDIADLHMPRQFETYKIKTAIEKDKLTAMQQCVQQQKQHQSPKKKFYPVRMPVQHIFDNRQSRVIPIEHENAAYQRSMIISQQPTVPPSQHQQCHQPRPIAIYHSPSPTRQMTNNSQRQRRDDSFFKDIIQDRLSEMDQRIANEIRGVSISSSAAKLRKSPNKQYGSMTSSDMAADQRHQQNEDEDRTDRDQDSIELSDSSNSLNEIVPMEEDYDDLNINDEEMKNFENYGHYAQAGNQRRVGGRAMNNLASLENPSQLVSDFYISNMNYAMRYSVEYMQQMSKDMRRRRLNEEKMIQEHQEEMKKAKNRSLSVDRLYAIRKEHIRYANGAQHQNLNVHQHRHPHHSNHHVNTCRPQNNANNISFTTDDIQDLYMPSAIENYKRKIAVELERRRRCELHSACPIHGARKETRQQPAEQVVLDDLDLFMMKKSGNQSHSRVIRQSSMNQAIKTYQPIIHHKPGCPVHKNVQLKTATSHTMAYSGGPVTIASATSLTNVISSDDASMSESLASVSNDDMYQINKPYVVEEHHHFHHHQVNRSNSQVRLDHADIGHIEHEQKSTIVISKHPDKLVALQPPISVDNEIMLHKADDIKIVETSKLAKVQVNTYRPLNMAHETIHSQNMHMVRSMPDSPSVAESSVVRISSTVRRSDSIHCPPVPSRVNILHAAHLISEQVNLTEGQMMPTSNDTMFMTQATASHVEYGVKNQPVNSTVTYSYESAGCLIPDEAVERPEQATVSISEVHMERIQHSPKRPIKLNMPEHIIEQTTLISPPNSITSDEYIDLEVANASLTSMVVLERPVAVNKPRLLNKPVDVKSEISELHLFDFNPPVIDHQTSILHIEQAPDFGVANLIEYKHVNILPAVELNLQQAETIPADDTIEIRHVKQQNHRLEEMEHSVEWTRHEVFNLAQYHDDGTGTGLDRAHSFYSNKPSEEYVNMEEEPIKLASPIKKSTLRVLSMSNQQPLTIEQLSVVELAPSIPSPDVACATSEQNLDTTVQVQTKVSTYYLPQLQRVPSIKEEHSQLIEIEEDYSVTMVPKLNSHQPDQLIDPVVVQKPVMLNKGYINEYKQKAETAEAINVHMPPLDQAFLNREDEADLSMHPDNIQPKVKPFSMSLTNQINLDQTRELHLVPASPEKTNVVRTAETITAITNAPPQVMETVERMDDESFSVEIEHKVTSSFTPVTLVSKLDRVDLVKPLIKARTHKDIVTDENCQDLLVEQRRDQKAVPLEHRVDLNEPSFVEKSRVTKIGFGQLVKQDFGRDESNEAVLLRPDNASIEQSKVEVFRAHEMTERSTRYEPPSILSRARLSREYVPEQILNNKADDEFNYMKLDERGQLKASSYLDPDLNLTVGITQSHRYSMAQVVTDKTSESVTSSLNPSPISALAEKADQKLYADSLTLPLSKLPSPKKYCAPFISSTQAEEKCDRFVVSDVELERIVAHQEPNTLLRQIHAIRQHILSMSVQKETEKLTTAQVLEDQNIQPDKAQINHQVVNLIKGVDKIGRIAVSGQARLVRENVEENAAKEFTIKKDLPEMPQMVSVKSEVNLSALPSQSVKVLNLSRQESFVKERLDLLEPSDAEIEQVSFIKEKSTLTSQIHHAEKPLVMLKEKVETLRDSHNEKTDVIQSNYNLAQADIKKEENDLITDADSKLHIWLNCPKISVANTDSHQTIDIDEKLDILYEHLCVRNYQNELSESDLVQVQNVLSLFWPEYNDCPENAERVNYISTHLYTTPVEHVRPAREPNLFNLESHCMVCVENPPPSKVIQSSIEQEEMNLYCKTTSICEPDEKITNVVEIKHKFVPKEDYSEHQIEQMYDAETMSSSCYSNNNLLFESVEVMADCDESDFSPKMQKISGRYLRRVESGSSTTSMANEGRGGGHKPRRVASINEHFSKNFLHQVVQTSDENMSHIDSRLDELDRNYANLIVDSKKAQTTRLKDDSDTIEIFTEIRKQTEKENKSGQNYANSSVVNESIRNYLDNITNASVGSMAAGHAAGNLMYPSDDQDEDTSIQETVMLNNNLIDKSYDPSSRFQTVVQETFHHINYSPPPLMEHAEEVDDFYKYQAEKTAALWSKYSPSVSRSGSPTKSMLTMKSPTFQPIRGSSIAKIVSPCPEIVHFDDHVEVIDSVVIDHVSEDDRSVSSEEVTYERWTEETRLIKTKVFRDGCLVDEYIQRCSPELVGNILREKLIERHEHIKHISQDILKRVRVKSPGRSLDYSTNGAGFTTITDDDLDSEDRNVIIVEPKKPISRNLVSTTTTCVDNNYVIQHQQLITPSMSSSMAKKEYLEYKPYDGARSSLGNELNESKANADENIIAHTTTTTFNAPLIGNNDIIYNNHSNITATSTITLLTNPPQQANPIGLFSPGLNDDSRVTVSQQHYFRGLQAHQSGDELNVSKSDDEDDEFQDVEPIEHFNLGPDSQSIEPVTRISESTVSSSSSVSNSDDAGMNTMDSMEKFERPSQSELKQIKEAASTSFSPDSSNRFLNSPSTQSPNVSYSVGCHPDVSLTQNGRSPRNNKPLRRESFEMAQNNPRRSLKATIKSAGDSTSIAANVRYSTTNSPKLVEEEDSDTSSSSSSNTDRFNHNYQVLRRKSSNSSTHNNATSAGVNKSFVSTIDTTIRPKPVPQTIKPQPKIKVVPRANKSSPRLISNATSANGVVMPSSNSAQDRVKSISPRLLRRGLDIVETIETKTCMSFIQNKSVNLVIEERREKPLAEQQIPTEVKKPASMTNQLVKPIPITVTHHNAPVAAASEDLDRSSRSKSATPKLVDSPKNNRITFHKYDSNEIIAVVNVPDAYEHTTIGSVATNNPDNSFSRSEPNLDKCVESNPKIRRQMPRLATIKRPVSLHNNGRVDFEIEIQKSPPLSQSNSHSVFVNGKPVQTTMRSRSTNGMMGVRNSLCVENVAPGNQVVIQSCYVGGPESSVNNVNNETTTRISSGYFSGDEFRPYYSNTLNNNTSSVAVNNNYRTASINNTSSFSNYIHSGSPTISSSTTTTSNIMDSSSSHLAHKPRMQDVEFMVDRNEPEYVQSYFTNDNSSYNNSSWADRVRNDMAARRKRGPNLTQAPNTYQRLIAPPRSTSLNNMNTVILPSPTSADYLRNNTRQSVAIKKQPPQRQKVDELNQILYDDMAYRQLRKDQIRPSSTIYPSQQTSQFNNYFPNLTNISSLPPPAPQAVNESLSSDDQSSSVSPPRQVNYADLYKSTTGYGGGSGESFYYGNNLNKTVRMLKQKTNKIGPPMCESRDRYNYQIMNESLNGYNQNSGRSYDYLS